MAEPEAPALEERFLVVAPIGRDASLTTHLLARGGLNGFVCASVEELCKVYERDGAAALMITEEALTPAAQRTLCSVLARQGAWSDIPVLIFIGSPARLRPAELVDTLGNVTLLERPLRPITMLSAAQAALRARRRQYAARAELVTQQRAVKQRDQFLAMLGHELRNPLSAISLALSLDERGPSSHGEIMKRQVRHLTHLVDDLLDTARVTSGKVTLKRQDLDLNELVRTSVNALRPNVEVNRTSLLCETARGPLYVHVDPVRIEQVLTNLITNASKYTPPGGTIRVSTERQGEAVLLAVRDTGVGLAPDMLTQVFELFAQVDGTLDRSKGGLGLGLTLVRSLVELHGGSVRADSAGLGKGTVFTVTLPLLAAAAVQAQGNGHSAATVVRRQAHDVLVIEDNEDSRTLLTMLLERRGHRVISATDGLAGVEAAVAHKPSVLLADIGLPGLDGYGVARRVRELLGDRVFMIAITGYGQPEDRQRALAAGFNLHLTKPVDPDALDLAFTGLAS